MKKITKGNGKHTTRGEIKNGSKLKRGSKEKIGRMEDIKMLGTQPRFGRINDPGDGLAKWRKR